MTQVFAPTTFRITFETEGAGKFTPEEVENIVIRDKKTHEVIGIDLPDKMVFIANHQVCHYEPSSILLSMTRSQIYADWWYLWGFTYFLNMHKDITIVLKKSLKWLPILGWVCGIPFL